MNILKEIEQILKQIDQINYVKEHFEINWTSKAQNALLLDFGQLQNFDV